MMVILPEKIIHLQKNPNFSTLGSIIEISRQEPSFGFTPDDNLRGLLGFNPRTKLRNINYHLIRLIYYRLITFSSKQILLK